MGANAFWGQKRAFGRKWILFQTIALCLVAIATPTNAESVGTLPFSDNLLIINGKVISGSDVGNIGIKGNGKLREETRDLGDFQQIKLEVAADVEYRRGDKHIFKIRAESNLIPLIKSEVSNGQLRVYAAESYQSTKEMNIQIQSPHILRLEHQGSGDVSIRDLKEQSFTLNLEGQSDVMLDGYTKQFTLNISGSGDVNAKQLIARDCSFSLMGSSDITAYCGESIGGSLMGASDVEIYGDPKLRALESMGAGDIDYR